MSDSIERGFRAMAGSGAELKRTAKYYETPATGGPAHSNAGTDVEDPLQHLKPPGSLRSSQIL